MYRHSFIDWIGDVRRTPDRPAPVPTNRTTAVPLGKPQNPFFLDLFKVTFRYRNRGGFLGSFTIGFRSSLPSANVCSRTRSSPSCSTSTLIGFFGIRKNEIPRNRFLP